MKKKLPKGKVRCATCKIILSMKEANEHFKSKKHRKKIKEIVKAYEESLRSLTNFKGL